ncbi:hypothetical protein [Fluviicola taffensis]|uniref:hypothetical protein n=1 Tax=Fluviicola taffensis TaxID=191579 RepID=UPI0031380216
MKTGLTLLFAIFIGTGFSQTDPDSLQLQKSDSTWMFMLPDSLSAQFFLPKIPHYTSYKHFDVPLMIFMPNCADLIKREGLFYLGQDSLPYCGNCTVLYGSKKNPITYQYPNPNIDFVDTSKTSQSNWSMGYFITKNEDKVKIVSSYTYGKRDGHREYYDINGKLYKIEIYKNGKWVSTDYID